MKIDRAKLIELLVEKTGMDSEEIDSQLKQLIDRILDAAERGKALEIKEFGMFYFDESGDLKFDPSDELSTEINFKYAGMEPVELKPPRSGSKEAEEEKADKTGTATGEDLDEIFGLDDDEGPIEDDAEGPDGGALISPPDKVERDIDPFSGLLGDASSKLKGSDESKEESEEDDPEEDPFSFILEDEPEEKEEKPEEEDIEDEPVFELDDEIEIEPEKAPFDVDDTDDGGEGEDEEYFDPFEESEKEEPETQPIAAKKPEEKKKPAAKKPSYKKSKTEKERDPIMMVISIGLVIILIVAAFFIIPELFDSSQQPSTQTQTQEEPVTEQPQEPASETPAVEEENQALLTPVEPEGESQVTDDEPAEEIQDQPVYGLMGDLVEQANNGYSIVLHSLQSEEGAREQAALLAADGYRVLVSPRTVSGNTVWRVSVGQFETLQDAQQAATELPSPYNSNNFIQRIQTN